MLYKSLVHPHLEYGHVVYFHRYERQVALIENVQRRGTKMDSGLKDLTYADRLRLLNFPLMAHRRRGDLIETYKYLHGLYNVEPCPLIFDSRQRNITCGHK